MKHSSKIFFEEEPTAPLKACDHHACSGSGSFPAPKSRRNLRDYYWFCLIHVREYNLKWNYYASMTEHEIEESRAFDARWERPTNPFGKGVKRFKPAFIDPMGAIFSTHTSTDFQSCPFPAHSEEMKALNLFQLSYPLKRDALKIRYKELVKKFHPDVNQGSSEAEATLKKITHAYSILKKIL